MYPLVIILGIASFRSDQKIASYLLPIGLVGWGIAFYHYFVVEQKILGGAEFSACRSGVSCDYKWIDWFGFVTIPFMSFTAFTLITIFMIYIWRAARAASASEAAR